MTGGRLWVFFAWLALFYAGWAGIVAAGDFHAEVREHWPIALSMAAGSYFAGSTPMGGGTVGFPVLVLLFDAPASLGRDFGFAVQSIGMVSASIYILSARVPVDRSLLKWALLGAVVSTPLCAAFLAPNVDDTSAKLLFAVIWCSFGLIHFQKLRAIVHPEGSRHPEASTDRNAGLAIGITGGAIASLTGVGIDMLLYAVMVLYYRADLKLAIPTSVILMAATSLIGLASNLALGAIVPGQYGIEMEVFYNWLAAAPVVALGAPLGALVVRRLPRAPTLLIVSALCVGQYVWMLVDIRPGPLALFAALAGVLAVNLLFLKLFGLGEARAHRRR